jgi:hypothetical protein
MDDREYQLEQRRYRQEWFKVFFSALTAITLAVLAFVIHDTLKVREAALKTGEQIIAQKQSIYSRLGDRLNVIYVYVADVGDFRQYTPPQIVQRKRECDRLFFSYRFYWSTDTEKKYGEFMQAAFQAHNGVGFAAKIRALNTEKVAAYDADKRKWNTEWNAYFTGERDTQLQEKYYELVHALLADSVNYEMRKAGS